MDGSTDLQISLESKTRWVGTLEIALAFSLAGSSLVVAKILSVRVPVFLTGFLSLVIAFICMLPFQLKRRWELGKLDKREWVLMFFQALFGIVLFRVFTLYGLQLTTTANAAVITAATPAVMALFSVILLKEKLNLNGVVGVSAALGTLLLINLQNVTQVSASGDLGGNLLIGLAVVSDVLLTIFRRFSRAGISAITNTTVLTSISIVLMWPFAMIELKTFSILQMTTVDWFAIFYYGAIATAAAYILWGDGAMKIPATYTGVACVSMPISALILSGIVLGEPLTSYHLLGCGLAVLGIVVCHLDTLFISDR